jgi:hypothetical protein
MGHPSKANPILNFDILFVSDSLVSNNLVNEVYQSTYTPRQDYRLEAKIGETGASVQQQR